MVKCRTVRWRRLRREKKETEESDHFEDYNYRLEITLIFHVKLTNLDYEHPPTTRFYHVYTPPVNGHKERSW